MTRIVLLEDEADLREEIAADLVRRGHEVAEADSLAAFAPLAGRFDLAIIDLGLPDGSGLQAIRTLRVVAPGVGIVVLTARSAMKDRIDSLQGGADQYLVKPVRLAELAAHVEALARRVAPAWRVETARQRLCAPDGAALALSMAETRLLAALARQPGRALARRELVEAMGFDWAGYDERRLEALVSRLRRRWREQAGADLPLRTEHGVGYRFVTPLLG